MNAAAELIGLIDVSRRLGENSELVQAGGGNTSIKLGSIMYIKASGVRLRDVDVEAGLVGVDVAALSRLLSDTELSALPVPLRDLTLAERLTGITVGRAGRRASIETWAHAVFGRCVVHTHPVPVNAIACVRSCGTILEHLFGDEEPRPLVVPYVAPGYPLARVLGKAVSDYRFEHGQDPNVVFLTNHGLITVGDSPQEASRLTFHVMEVATAAVGGEAEPGLAGPVRSAEEILPGIAELEGLTRSKSLRVCRDPWVSIACHHPRGRAWLCERPLFPDQVVYCGPAALWVDTSPGTVAQQIARYIREVGTSPRVIVVPGSGVILAAESEKSLDAAEEVLRAHVRVSMLGERLGELNRLSAEDIAYLAGWEAEHFREQAAWGD